MLFDTTNITIRSDGLAIVSLFQQMASAPGQGYEIFRGVATVTHLKKVVDVFARSLDHYPTKEIKVRPTPPEGAS